MADRPDPHGGWLLHGILHAPEDPAGPYVHTITPAPEDRILWEHDRRSVDEFVVHNATVHLEQMSDDCYWLGIERDGRMLMVNIYRAKKRDPLRCHVEADGSDWPWHRDEEHPE